MNLNPNPRSNPNPNSNPNPDTLTLTLPQLLHPCSHSYCQTRRLLLTLTLTLSEATDEMRVLATSLALRLANLFRCAVHSWQRREIAKSLRSMLKYAHTSIEPAVHDNSAVKANPDIDSDPNPTLT